MSKSSKQRKAAQKHSTIDKTTYDRRAISNWCMSVSAALKAYASKVEHTDIIAAVESLELAENAELWAKWCKNAPALEFNAQCEYWARCSKAADKSLSLMAAA